MSKNILICSNEPWGDVWYSKQHYAFELAKAGHYVYFLNPFKKWSWKALIHRPAISKLICENLMTIDYRQPLPLGSKIKAFGFINDYLLFRRIRRISHNQDLLIWNFDPFRITRVFHPNYAYLYHVVDKYAFPSDLEIAKSADLIVVVNEGYATRYSPLHKDILHVPHGVSDQEYQLNQEAVRQFKNKYDKFLIYVGTIHSGIDLELLQQIANTYPSINIVLVGPVVERIQQVERLMKLPNVIIHGTIHAQELKHIIAASLIGLVPYKMAQAYRSPLKILSYLAQGKPVVTVPISEWEKMEGRMIFTAHSHSEFIEKVSFLLENPTITDRSVSDNYLKTVNYKSLINNIIAKLDS